VALTIPEAREVDVRVVLSSLIKLIVVLEKNKPLRKDEWLRRVEIQGSLEINGDKFFRILNGTDRSVNQALFGICPIRDIAIVELT
jgi:hypothetical protein